MALTYGFYNSVDNDRRYTAKQFGSIFDGVITDGVYANLGKRMVVKATGSGMSVTVRPGRAWFNHTWTLVDDDYTMQLPASEPSLDKIVAVVLEINEDPTVRANRIRYVEGTPATKPSRPELINTTLVHQYPLAYVNIDKGQTVIKQDDITNMVGSSKCPYVSGTTVSFNIDDLIDQWKSQWNTWFSDTKSSWSSWFSATKSSWNSFYSTSQSQWNNFYTPTVNSWTNYFNGVKSTWDSYFTGTKSNWDSFFNTVRSNWDSWYSVTKSNWELWSAAKNREWNTWFAASQNSFNVFMDQKEQEFETLLEYEDEVFDEALDTMKADFGDFWEDFKAGMQEYLDGQKYIWETWFNHIQGQLSHDAATNLQKQIDSLAYAFIHKRRAVLGITAYVFENMVVFGAWGAKSGERVIVGAPTMTNVYISGLRALISNIVATVNNRRVLFDEDWATLDGETVVITSPV